jgi:hypothetical protein
MANILAPVSVATTAITSISNLLLVSPQNTVGYQPQLSGGTTPFGPSFLFQYEGEQTALTEFDISDHFAEDNQSLQDQIAIKPNVITTHGFIGELNNIAPPILQALQSAASRLTTIGSYVPTLSATALIAYNEAFFAYQTAENAVGNLVSAVSSLSSGGSGQNVISGSSLTNVGGQNLQQSAYYTLYANGIARNLFTIQTPWAVFQNMAIKTIRAIQGAETTQITDFEVTFKQMRFASTQTVAAAVDAQGRLISQSASSVNYGTSALQPSTVSYPYASAVA